MDQNLPLTWKTSTRSHGPLSIEQTHPKPAGTADDGQAAGAAPLASTGAGTGPAIAVAGLLAMAGASLLAAVARTRRHGADPDGLTAD